MVKYHIAKDGKPALCRATTKDCPLGGIHGTLVEVQKEADQQNKEKYGILPSNNITCNLHSEVERTFDIQVEATESFTELVRLAKNLEKAYEINEISDKAYNQLNKKINKKKDKTSEAKQADEMIKEAETHEPQITKTLKDLEEITRGELIKFKNKLKKKDSLGMKIERFDQYTRVKDTLRYTYQVPPYDYTKTYNTIKKELTAKGYEQNENKNFWNNKKIAYQGINSWWTSPDGYIFEVQFHTPGSQDLKDSIHPIFEERKKQQAVSPKAQALEDEMHKLAKEVRVPRNVKNVECQNCILPSLR